MMRRITDEQAQGTTGPQKVLKKSLTIPLGRDCYFTCSSKPRESLVVWRTKEVPSFFNYYFRSPAYWSGPGKRTFDLRPVVMCSTDWANPVVVKGFVTETLKLRFFGISSEPLTSRSHVTWALPSGLRFEVQLCRLDHSPEVSDLPQGFYTLKHHKPTFEKKYDFLELFCLLIVEFYFKRT